MIKWTPDKDEVIRTMAAKGGSAQDIANALNAEFKIEASRLSAIGRCSRIGVTTKAINLRKGYSKPAPIPMRAEAPSRRIPDNFECHFIGEDDQYCYKKCKETYCTEHRAIVYAPTRPLKAMPRHV